MTLVCVSDAVGGGPDAGNARWLGRELAALLRKACIRRGADQVLSNRNGRHDDLHRGRHDPWTGRRALIAVGMNGQPLPTENGFPARMLVPGLYGYVSATKRVTRARGDDVRPPAGVLDPARLRPGRRRSGPSCGSTCRGRSRSSRRAGVAVGGVAGAPHRGTPGCKVNVDNGSVADRQAGRRRRHRHLAAVGLGLGCRRPDCTPSRSVPPTAPARCRRRSQACVFPSGATGWDSVVVTVT